ncbi:hypothetical protein BJX64DRAFT_293116 [Aspergillus heterothallicus]
MASHTSIISLHRTLLYLLSLASVSVASEQDIFTHATNPDSKSSYTRNLVSKTFSYGGNIPPPTLSPSADTHTGTSIPSISIDANPHRDSSNPARSDEDTPLGYDLCPAGQKRCTDVCIPSTQDCCSASTHCFPGDYCFHHDGEVRCCPEGLSCFTVSGDVCYEQMVFWYEEVHVHFVDMDDAGMEGEKVAVVTEWDMGNSVLQTHTRVTVTASYPVEGRGEFARLSRGIVREVETRIMLDEVPTRTRTMIRTVQRTSTVDMMFDGLKGAAGQIVLG